MPTATSRVTTRDRLLDAAEELFARRGLQAVSLREIGLAADQRNNGVIQYHFGDKAALVRAVFERRAAIVDARRIELLDATLAAGDRVPSALLRAYLIPLAEQVAAGNWYVPFLSRLQAEHQRDELLAGVSAPVSTAYTRVRALLRDEHLAGLPSRRFAIRWRLALNLSVDALADRQASPGPGPLDAFVSELAVAISGLLLGGP